VQRGKQGSGLQFCDSSSTTNRITASGFSYDSSGNLTNDGVHSYGFDGDGKIAKVDSTTAYVYDGEGRRVKKLLGETTRFVYGIGGLIAEYDSSNGNLQKEYIAGGGSMITIEPPAVNSNGAQYATGDHLGSSRVITNSSGSVVSRHDYMPFGEDLGASVGGRTTGMGFSGSGDTNRKKFTGYERDNETGLDFAQARFYSSPSGRFTSPDPFSASAVIADPQTFNRYGYCRNNPVNSVDPTGLSAYAAMRSDDERSSSIQGAWDSGHAIIEEEEAKYEQQVHDAFSGIDQHEIVTVMISDVPSADPPSGSTAASTAGQPPKLRDSNSDCSIRVIFLGPQIETVGRHQSYGFAFLVFGTVRSSQIGRVGDPNADPEKLGRVHGILSQGGDWTIGQSVHPFVNTALFSDGTRAVQGKYTLNPLGKRTDDSPNPESRNIKGRNFWWGDAPGTMDSSGSRLVSGRWSMNFSVYARNGPKQCMVSFSLEGEFTHGRLSGRIGPPKSELR
jgi:RHS repeat-associated protein